MLSHKKATKACVSPALKLFKSRNYIASFPPSSIKDLPHTGHKLDLNTTANTKAISFSIGTRGVLLFHFGSLDTRKLLQNCTVTAAKGMLPVSASLHEVLNMTEQECNSIFKSYECLHKPFPPEHKFQALQETTFCISC